LQEGSIATGYKIALIASAVVLATALFATAAARQPSGPGSVFN